MAIAVVTGAARGIGAAIAGRLESDGFEVVRLDVVGGDGVITCDVADHAQVDEVAAKVAADVGPVDVLVNNAGIWRFGPLESVDPVDFRHVLDVNLGGAFHCTQAFGPPCWTAAAASSTSCRSPRHRPTLPPAPTRRRRPPCSP